MIRAPYPVPTAFFLLGSDFTRNDGSFFGLERRLLSVLTQFRLTTSRTAFCTSHLQAGQVLTTGTGRADNVHCNPLRFRLVPHSSLIFQLLGRVGFQENLSKEQTRRMLCCQMSMTHHSWEPQPCSGSNTRSLSVRGGFGFCVFPSRLGRP